MKAENQEQLGDLFFRNELNESQKSHLKNVLKQGGSECDEFLDQLYANQQLVTVGQQIQSSNQVPKQKQAVKIRFGRIAAAAMLACGLFYFLLSSLKQSVPEERKPVLAKWVKLSEDAQVMTQVSRYMHPGHQKLPEGNYQLVFSNGTKVNLNQKAEINLIDEENMVLHYGNLLAEVSNETKSFSVRTPGAHVVDLGTVFGIRVDREQNSNVYVTQGLVAVSSLDFEERQVLRMGDQIDVDVQGQFASKRRYIEPLEELIPEIQAMPNRTDLTWMHWSFDDDFKASLKVGEESNLEVLPLHDQQNALPKVCESPFGKGIRFDGLDDAMVTAQKKLAPSGERTLSCWVRLPQNQSSEWDQTILFAGDAEYHPWKLTINQMASEGQKNAVKLICDDGYLTGETHLADGRWHHIAITFLNGDQSNVSTHVLLYIDGVLEKASSHRAQTRALKVHSGLQDLNLAVSPVNNEYFKGDLDELWVFDQALLPEEIVHLRDNNSPYSK